jgi:Zn-finger protein
MENSHKFFANRDCKYYPCHKGLDELNCLFCFCPLYHKSDCGGDYTLSASGKKNCSRCIKPHIPENYDLIVRELRAEGD